MGTFKKFCILLPVLLLLVIRVSADDSQRVINKNGVTLKLRRLSDKVLVLTEDTYFANNFVVISSKKGLVVIDTSSSIATARAVREIAEREFKRKDFACVVITHHHWDHTSGNQVFADVEIIGHERSIEHFKPGDNADFIETLTRHLKAGKKKLAEMDPNSREAKTQQKRVHFIARSLETQKHLKPTPPDITFNDRLNLDLEDITLKLIYFGRAHTGSDILIQVPEEGLLLTGDLFLDENWLPLFADSQELDIPMWIDALHLVLDGKTLVKYVIPAHKRFWTREKLIMWRDYIVKLWNGVNAPAVKGLEFEQIPASFPLEEKFFYLKKLGHTEQQIREYHRENIRSFRMQTKKKKKKR
ncbi:MAG: MBL fold metallo-hydrolase [bacterium]|nr:MBL fold metallo-hydrolase [bacterium]